MTDGLDYMGGDRFAVAGDGLAPRYPAGAVIHAGLTLSPAEAAESGQEVVLEVDGDWIVGRVAKDGAGWKVRHPWQARDIARRAALGEVAAIAAIATL